MNRAAIACLLVCVVFPGVGLGQQAQVSCEERLAQANTTLLFTRAGRNGTEESAGLAVVTLQRQLDTLQHEIDALKKAQKALDIQPSAQKENQ